MKASIGRYRVERMLGQGGMGIVYAARDDQLGRPVAVKTIREDRMDPAGRERLWREARAAAAVTHPNVCHVYEVGEDGGSLYIAMELLEGEPLVDRLARGAVPVGEAVPIALGMLSALDALHARGIVHRDLKPGNVFLTPHGVKLLDFGLARGLGTTETALDLKVTATGFVAGTPRYMAPEQLEGGEAVPASDLFAFGSVLFEMLAGRPAFDGSSIWEVSHAVLHDQPPALTGGAGTSALDAVIRRCLAKRPADRFPTPAAVAEALRAASALYESRDTGTLPVRAATRLMVLPFRLLRPDPDIDFLSFSLADSLIASLTGLGPLVVRSSHVAERFAGETLDLRRIASEGQVDAVLTGSLLRSGGRLRLVAQLVEAPGGTVLWSRTMQVELGDVFEVQDELARQVVESLKVPLSGRERGLLDRDVPASGHAYELYLRANHLSHDTVDPSRLLAARELYAACLAEDPKYAPAWARIGRVYRVLAKFASERDPATVEHAKQAFERAFVLNPQLAIAHHLYTYFEIEELGRADAAMTRLLARVRETSSDADLYAGLVTACRFCGLLTASLAADARAKHLDPGVRTSVQYTWALLNDEPQVGRLIDHRDPDLMLYMLMQNRRLDEARDLLRRLSLEASQVNTAFPEVGAVFITAVAAALEGRREETVALLGRLGRSGFRDPEGLYFTAAILVQAGAVDEAVARLEETVDGGFLYFDVRTQPWLRPLLTLDRFERLMARASAARARAADAFQAADGPRLLGVTTG